MMPSNNTAAFSDPGARTTRQENLQTEVAMPLLQGGVRILTDAVAAFCILTVLLILGRWAIWFVGLLFFFSQWWQIRADRFVVRFTGIAAVLLDYGLVLLQWAWTLGGGWLLAALTIPLTWTMDGRVVLQTATIAPAWPMLFWRAGWEIPFSPFARLIALILVVAPLFTWKPMRDRMKWSLWEFYPPAAVDVATHGVDPNRWGQAAAPKPVTGAGVIIERVDYDPHTTVVAEGVAISNASGNHLKRTDMGWVSHEQWGEVARLLITLGRPFSEQELGRGRVFPTHGPEDVAYGGRLGFRFFREQMLNAGMLRHRGNHPNEGYELTEAGDNFLRHHFLESESESAEGDFNE